MIVLGLHFGHDAAVALLKDGKVLYALEKERTLRVKHAVGVQAADIVAALEAAGIDIADVDCCAITNTQNYDYLFFDASALSFTVDVAVARVIPSPYQDMLDIGKVRHPPTQPGILAHIMAAKKTGLVDRPDWPGAADDPFTDLAPKILGRDTSRGFDGIAVMHSTENFYYLPTWNEHCTLPQIAATSYGAMLDPVVGKSFHLPVTVQVLGRQIPGAMISHHYAHASYAFFESPFESAAILSCDGSTAALSTYDSGMFYWGSGAEIYPLTPHFLSIGPLYTVTATHLRMDPGRMMGLAAYGEPRLFDPAYVGNQFDEPQLGHKAMIWFDHVVARARDLGYDMAPLSDRARITEPVNADIAASTQKCFEETMLRAAAAFATCLTRTGVFAPRLCLSGGVMLNCPSNTRLLRESAFNQIFVPPAVSDSGLAVGACYALYHAILGHPRPSARATDAELIYRAAPYAGTTIERTITSYGDRIVASRPADAAEEAARMLSADAIIGWFEGASELGPRALGHRSILANPCSAENWRRVNVIKGRELWRPLAPAVLKDKADAWFAAGPSDSPFMLFNHTVIGDRLPAITHVDGTARVQTVEPANGGYFRVLSAFDRLTGVPVLLNTSFNGPGEPIVETPAHAIDFLLSTPIDAVFVDGWKIVRP